MQTLIPTNPLDNLTRIEYKGQPVLTTAQLAAALSTPEKIVTTQNLIYNFNYNASRYVEGKHFFKLEGKALAIFKNIIGNSNVVPQRTSRFMLWTKRGCLHHCKSVNTDVAWKVYEYLEDHYFNTLASKELPPVTVDAFERADAMRKLACHTKAPYKREKLVAEAANLLFGREEFTAPNFQPVEQLSLFYFG